MDVLPVPWWDGDDEALVIVRVAFAAVDLLCGKFIKFG